MLLGRVVFGLAALLILLPIAAVVFAESSAHYACEGFFRPGFECNKAFDGDTMTSAVPNDYGDSVFVIEEHPIPSGISGAIWQFRVLRNAPQIEVTAYYWNYNTNEWDTLYDAPQDNDYRTYRVPVPANGLITSPFRTRVKVRNATMPQQSGEYFDGAVDWIYPGPDQSPYYSCEGIFRGGFECWKAVDGDTSTSAVPNAYGDSVYVTEEHTVPFNVSGAIWQFRVLRNAPQIAVTAYYWNYSTNGWDTLYDVPLDISGAYHTYRVPVPGNGLLSSPFKTKVKVRNATMPQQSGEYFDGLVDWIPSEGPIAKIIESSSSTCNPANAPAGIAVRFYAQSTDSICGITVPITWPEWWDLDSVSRAGALTAAWEIWDSLIDNDGDSVKFGGARTFAQAIPPGDSQLIATLYFHPTITVGITDSLLLVIDTFTTAVQSALAFADCSPQSNTYVPEISFDTSVFYGYMAGDANGDGVVNIGDCVYIINYVFRAGLAPVPLNAGDPNGDCAINVGDAVYLVNYIFRQGPSPLCGCVTGPAACCQGNDVPDMAYKPAPVSVSTTYDGDVTEVVIQSPVDIYGLQIEVGGDNGAPVVNQVEQTQLYHRWINGTATIGIMDINGVGRIPAGKTTVLTIAGEATILSALGADIHGQTFEITVGTAAKTDALPSRFALHQNRPNPFNPTTEISFSLPSATDVTLEVYNITGQRIAVLVHGHLEAGNHMAIWDGKDESGRTVSSGIYLYRIKAGEFSETKKMVLLK